MSEEVKMALDEAAEAMSKTITHLESELNKVRAGKASPVMLDGVRVDYYGTMTPLKNVVAIYRSGPIQKARTLVLEFARLVKRP